MTKKKSNTQEQQCPDYSLTLTKELADLLHQKQDDRYSKFEAFRSLLQRQAVASKENHSDDPVPFALTVTQLSIEWKWHRHTVTSFLDDLMMIGVITLSKSREGVVLCFTNLIFPSLIV